jgi:phosphoglycolate phosphatase
MNVWPHASGRWSAAIFDLDGTLVDTTSGVRAAVAAALAEATGDGSAAERADLSLPLEEMIRSADPAASASRRRLLADGFRRQYDSTYWKYAHVYPGAEACLRDLRTAGLRAFVVTNKRATPAERILEHFQLARYLDAIVGQADSGTAIPKAELIGRCLAEARLDPATTVIVGDSDQDAAAAASWSMVFIAVTSGAGPLGHASTGETRVEIGSLADAAEVALSRLSGRRS